MLRREGAPGFRLNNEPYAGVWCRPCSSVVRIKHAKIAYGRIRLVRPIEGYRDARTACPALVVSRAAHHIKKTRHAPQKRTKGQRCGSQYFWLLLLFMQTRLQGGTYVNGLCQGSLALIVCPLRLPGWATGSHSWTAMHLCTGYLLSPLCDLFPPTPTLRSQGWLDGRKDGALTL